MWTETGLSYLNMLFEDNPTITPKCLEEKQINGQVRFILRKSTLVPSTAPPNLVQFHVIDRQEPLDVVAQAHHVCPGCAGIEEELGN